MPISQNVAATVFAWEAHSTARARLGASCGPRPALRTCRHVCVLYLQRPLFAIKGLADIVGD